MRLTALILLAGAGLLPRPSLAAPSPVRAGEAVYYPEDPAPDDLPFLHLRRGALVESVAFSCAYLRAAPAEDCVVLTQLAGARAGGVAVYTRAGRVWLRSVADGTVVLTGLQPDDLNRPERILAAIGAVVPPVVPREPADTGESDASQLRRAAAAVSFFPSVLREVRLGRPGGDPAATPATTFVVLDWDQRHFLWNPATGVIEVPVPINPLTQAPYLCVAQPELPGSVLFAAEYSRRHPEERAEVLLDPQLCGHPLAWFARGAAVAAYTDRGRVGLHNGAENIPLPDATAADFADLPRLTARAFARYHQFLEDRGSRAGPVPAGLLGDTADLQRQRAHFRLQVANARPGRIRGGQSVLIIECGCLQCVYAPGRGAAYSGWLPPYQALLVDGIVFAGAYRRAHPGERTVVVAHPPTGRLTYPQGGINADVYYTRDGALWGHLGEDHAGEYPIAGSRAAEIGDRERLVELVAHNPARQARLAQTAAEAFAGDYRRPPAEFPAFDPRSFGTEAVLALLQAQGVPCRTVPERERAEDGRIREYPAAAVLFRWAGECFAYARQRVFRARACGYLPDPALD